MTAHNGLDKELISKLASVERNTEFIKHVFCMLKTGEQKQIMLTFLNSNQELTWSIVLQRMLEIMIKV